MEKHGDGLDLFEFIEKCPKVTEPLVSYMFRQVIAGLSYLHSKNILHRDVKVYTYTCTCIYTYLYNVHVCSTCTWYHVYTCMSAAAVVATAAVAFDRVVTALHGCSI